MQYKLANGNVVTATAYPPMVGTLNVQTTRGEVKARAGDVLVEANNCSFVMTPEAFDFLIEGSEILDAPTQEGDATVPAEPGAAESNPPSTGSSTGTSATSTAVPGSESTGASSPAGEDLSQFTK